MVICIMIGVEKRRVTVSFATGYLERSNLRTYPVWRILLTERRGREVFKVKRCSLPVDVILASLD